MFNQYFATISSYQLINKIIKGYIFFMNPNILNHAYLIKELTKREILGRYRGSFFGLAWTLITPLAMLGVFAFVFGEIFKAKWPSSGMGDDTGFILNLFIGLSVFWFFSEILNKAPRLFSSVPNYIKKVVFPLGVLPIVSLLGALFHFCVYMLIIVLIAVFSKGVDLSLISLPLVIGVSFPMLLGISLFLGSLGVYIKDIGTVMGVIVSMLMFLSPIFYPLESLSQNLQTVFLFNPLTVIIEQTRTVVIHGAWCDFEVLFYYFIVSCLVFAGGLKTYRVTKKGFADVI